MVNTRDLSTSLTEGLITEDRFDQDFIYELSVVRFRPCLYSKVERCKPPCEEILLILKTVSKTYSVTWRLLLQDDDGKKLNMEDLVMMNPRSESVTFFCQVEPSVHNRTVMTAVTLKGFSTKTQTDVRQSLLSTCIAHRHLPVLRSPMRG